MSVLKERTGDTYGRLKVTARAGNGPGGKARWFCQCVCGNEVIANAWDLEGGRTQSCGCLQSERTAASNVRRTKHGHARQSANKASRLTTPEYRSWKAMLERCRNPNAPNYHIYGGRGIEVCDRWVGIDGFVNFLADMGERSKGLTLDRIDVDGNYTPENCRWADAATQAKNRRQTRAAVAAQRRNLKKGRRFWPRKSQV